MVLQACPDQAVLLRQAQDERRSKGSPRTACKDIYETLHLKLFEIAPVNRIVLEDAFLTRFLDYEDAVIHESARHAGADGIVTRNRQDFKPATLRVYTPDELVQILRTLPSA